MSNASIEEAKRNLALYLQTTHPELLVQTISADQAAGIADAIERLISAHVMEALAAISRLSVGKSRE
jgi:hypothetical protein